MEKRTKYTLDEEQDRLSWLPGHLTDQILSFLPIKDAVRTSVLSSNWRKKWYTIPNIVLDRACVSHKSRLSKIVDHVLLVHSGAIDMFKFSDDYLVEDSLATNIDRWILHLIGRSFKELLLHISIWDDDSYKIPWCLFSYEGLLRLELSGCWLKPPMKFKGFKNLKSLDLYRVKVTQGDLEKLIFGCPLLEKLRWKGFYDLKETTIHAPNLKFLEIGGEFEDISFDNTFQLTSVSLDYWLDMKSESNQSMPGSSSNLLKFFDHQPHIQSLEIAGFFLKYLAAGVLPKKLPTPCINLSFLSITIHFDNMHEVSAALCLLKSSRNLQKLEIHAQRTNENIVPLTPSSYRWEYIYLGPAMPFRVQRVTLMASLAPRLSLI